MRLLKTLLILALLVPFGGAAVLWLGLYDVAADAPHWRSTHRVLELLRERSIARRAATIEVPDLSDPALIRSGAGNYGAMCEGCHLSPDGPETELSVGLYPRPPRWDEFGGADPRAAFWVIKHGIKASGMPAWGKSMDDRYIWGLVAFLQRLGTMTAAQYRAEVRASPGHSHGGDETGGGSGRLAEPADEPHSSPEPVAEPAEHDHDSHEH